MHQPVSQLMPRTWLLVNTVLEQFIEGQWKPISFFSRKFNPAELKYSAFDHELLAAYVTFHHFQFFLEGRVLHINTDHKPLIFALKFSTKRRSPHHAHHLAFIFEFTNDIHHIHMVSLILSLMSSPAIFQPLLKIFHFNLHICRLQIPIKLSFVTLPR